MLWGIHSYLWSHYETARSEKCIDFLILAQYVLIVEVTPRTAGRGESIDFTCFEQCCPIVEVTPMTAGSTEYVNCYLLWAMFLILEVTPRTAEVQNILIFTCSEQYFPVFEVAEWIDFYMFDNIFPSLRSLRGSWEHRIMLWARFLYCWGHSEDCQECRTYWLLYALSNMFLSLRSPQGLLGVKNVLFFTCVEHYFPILDVTPRTAGSAGHNLFHALSNMFLSLSSPQGLPGVKNALMFTC